ncbi:MAG TPA: hypothetical protein DCM28_07820 [Phycisphaerales bacterium]|nr:hypothetical protein [Phycisphaerales bacterium]HCD31554.1 hypothetical protein [Phycisphaerales bacterium]
MLYFLCQFFCLGFWDVSYSNINISVESTRFIEDGSGLHDAKIVDRTWRYVNKCGGLINDLKTIESCLSLFTNIFTLQVRQG